MSNISIRSINLLLIREFGISPSDYEFQFIASDGTVVDLSKVKVVAKGLQNILNFGESVDGDLMTSQNLRLFVSELFEVFGPSEKLLSELGKYHLRYVWQVLIAYDSLLETLKKRKEIEELGAVLGKIPGYSDGFRLLFVERFLAWAKKERMVVAGNPLDWLRMFNGNPALIQIIGNYILDQVPIMQKEM